LASGKLSLRVTQASLNQTAFDIPRNFANICEAVRIAVAEGSDVLALEELTLTGYDAGDDFQKTDNARILTTLEDIALYAKALDENLIVLVGHPWRYADKNISFEPERVKNPLFNRGNLPFNVMTLITQGEIQGMTAKMHLANSERCYEKRYFEEWSMAAAERIGGVYGTIMIPLAGLRSRMIPFGRPIFHITDGKNRFNLAQVICEEKWAGSVYDGVRHPEINYHWDNIIPSIGRQLRGQDGLLIAIADASPPAPDKVDKHEYLIGLASKYADAVVNTDGLGSSGSTFAQYGHRLIGQDGKIIVSGARAGFARVATTTTTIEIDQARRASENYTHGVLTHQFKNAAAKASPPVREASWDRKDNPNRVYEETIRMTALWLFDYMRKIKARGIAEALSGGMDSAFNSTMVSVMAHMAIKELGVEGFCREMSHLPYKDKILAAAKTGGEEAAIAECMKHMLTCVFMGTNNSSEGPGSTREAARFLIEGEPGKPGIGGKYYERNVQDMLDFYGVVYAVEDTTKLSRERLAEILKAVSEHMNLRPGSVTPGELEKREAAIKAAYPEVQQLISAANPAHGLTYENIQAGARQVLINRIGNMEGKLTVANPNLDETRNGYTTFGGDLHAGTISLNVHLPKRFQMRLMKHLHEVGLEGVMGPVTGLEKVMKKKPSAELQPRDASGQVIQNDEDALHGTFEQLDAIAEYMLYEQADPYDDPRRLNAGEIFERCKKDERFKGVSDTELYDMLCFRYKRWAIAQHKIHAAPVAPTFGRNVDHQVSQRTPNLSGEGRDELTALGVKLLFTQARSEGIVFKTQFDESMFEKRAQEDETFSEIFAGNLRGGGRLDFDLGVLYGKLKQDGLDKIFPPLPPTHEISVVYKARKAAGLALN